ncbi:MAG: porin family protein [Salinivirgaceae bacterium]|nr:porin family protein [Salinivirgaceae bacterium]
MNKQNTLYLSVLVLIFGFSNLNAQKPFKAGFSVGALTTQVDGDGYGGYDKSGIQAGAWVSREVSNDLILMLEIAYRPKGSKSSLKATIDDPDYYKLSLHYVEIPVTLRYRNKNYLFDVSLGAAYLAKESEKGYILGGLSSSETPGFNKFDLITAVGIGIQLNENWSITARFTYSVIDAAKNYRMPSNFRLQFNNALSLSLYRRIGR